MDHAELLANLNTALDNFVNSSDGTKQELKDDLEDFRDDIDGRIMALEEEIEEEQGEDTDEDEGDDGEEAPIVETGEMGEEPK
jgi:gas vesicle protein